MMQLSKKLALSYNILTHQFKSVYVLGAQNHVNVAVLLRVHNKGFG